MTSQTVHLSAYDSEALGAAIAALGLPISTRTAPADGGGWDCTLSAESPADLTAAVAVAEAHTGAPLSPVRLEALCKVWPGSAPVVDWTSAAQMAQPLVASVTFDLHSRITRIDWIDASSAAGVDPYGERYTGDVVLTEERITVEGDAGPASRQYTLTAYREDGTTAESWTWPDAPKGYPPAISKEKGDKRRARALNRVTMWLAGSKGGAAAVATWATVHGDAIRAFLELAQPGPLIAVVQAAIDSNEPGFRSNAGTLGIPLCAPEIAPTDKLGEALIAVLSTWLP